MLQLSDEMMRLHRRHDTAGRPLTRDIANQDAAANLRREAEGQRSQETGHGNFRFVLRALRLFLAGAGSATPR